MTEILFINGANLNNLGKRDEKIYGAETLNQLNERIAAAATANGASASFFTSNSEGDIINAIQAFNGDGIVINAGAYSHYSYAIADALLDKKCVKIEVHISNIFAREEHRRSSVLSCRCDGVIAGLGTFGYFAAMNAILSKIKN